MTTDIILGTDDLTLVADDKVLISADKVLIDAGCQLRVPAANKLISTDFVAPTSLDPNLDSADEIDILDEIRRLRADIFLLKQVLHGVVLPKLTK